MPRMNGLALCDAVNQDSDRQHIPVMLVSGSIHPDDPRTGNRETAALHPGVLAQCSTTSTPSDQATKITLRPWVTMNA